MALHVSKRANRRVGWLKSAVVFPLLALLGLGWLVSFGASPAAACSCFDIPTMLGSEPGPYDPAIVFYGSVIDSGPSNVTAEWALKQPGLALQFEVREVRSGDVGETVVVHTPGGKPLSGDCSTGVVKGEHLVLAYRGADNQLTGSWCTIVATVQRMSDGTSFEDFLDDRLGPAQGPDPQIAPEPLNSGEVRAPESEEPRSLEAYEELGPDFDFAELAAGDTEVLASGDEVAVEEVEPATTQEAPGRSRFWIAAGVLVSLIMVFTKRLRPTQ